MSKTEQATLPTEPGPNRSHSSHYKSAGSQSTGSLVFRFTEGFFTCQWNTGLWVTGLRTETKMEAFRGGPVLKNPPANAGDVGSIPGPGRFHMLQGN